MDAGLVAYSLNGSWDSPMGQAFPLRTPATLRPVVSFDAEFHFKINFGYTKIHVCVMYLRSRLCR